MLTRRSMIASALVALASSTGLGRTVAQVVSQGGQARGLAYVAFPPQHINCRNAVDLSKAGDFTLEMSAHDVLSVRRIWADGALIYDHARDGEIEPLEEGWTAQTEIGKAQALGGDA